MAYEIHLYNSQNAVQTYVADITPLVETFRYDVLLNNFEELSFSMDLYAWKLFCQDARLNPYTLLRPYTAEIKLLRNGVYLPFACEIKRSPKRYGSDTATIDIQARGTLSKLADALITKSYVNVDSAAISRDLIAVRQAKTYGNFGITNGNTFTTGVLSQRTYANYVIADAIRNLSDDQSGGFDFYFDHDWKYYTMDKRGSLKDDVTYTFGEDFSNVIEFENPEDGTVLANSVITIGQGIGDPITSSVPPDTTSAIEYGLRELALIQSSIDNQTWLDSKAAAEIRDRKNIYNLPTITVSGDDFDLNNKWVGDTIPLENSDPVSPYVGLGRIKRLTVDVDENHNEVIKVECLPA